MICKCGESTDNKYLCAHCTAEYERENNERYDKLKPITEDILDDMFRRRERVKGNLDHVFNRGI